MGSGQLRIHLHLHSVGFRKFSANPIQDMATCKPSFLYGVIYQGGKARVEEEKEVCFTIYQFEILLYELLELLFE